MSMIGCPKGRPNIIMCAKELEGGDDLDNVGEKQMEGVQKYHEKPFYYFRDCQVTLLVCDGHLINEHQ